MIYAEWKSASTKANPKTNLLINFKGFHWCSLRYKIHLMHVSQHWVCVQTSVIKSWCSLFFFWQIISFTIAVLQKHSNKVWKYLFPSPFNHHTQTGVHILKYALGSVCEYLFSHNDWNSECSVRDSWNCQRAFWTQYCHLNNFIHICTYWVTLIQMSWFGNLLHEVYSYKHCKNDGKYIKSRDCWESQGVLI